MKRKKKQKTTQVQYRPQAIKLVKNNEEEKIDESQSKQKKNEIIKNQKNSHTFRRRLMSARV